MTVEIRHVVIQHQVADALVTAPDGNKHRIGHIPGEGWVCTCAKGKACAGVQQVRALIPAIGPPEQEATATQ